MNVEKIKKLLSIVPNNDLRKKTLSKLIMKEFGVKIIESEHYEDVSHITTGLPTEEQKAALKKLVKENKEIKKHTLKNFPYNDDMDGYINVEVHYDSNKVRLW